MGTNEAKPGDPGEMIQAEVCCATCTIHVRKLGAPPEDLGMELTLGLGKDTNGHAAIAIQDHTEATVTEAPIQQVPRLAIAIGQLFGEMIQATQRPELRAQPKPVVASAPTRPTHGVAREICQLLDGMDEEARIDLIGSIMGQTLIDHRAEGTLAAVLASMMGLQGIVIATLDDIGANVAGASHREAPARIKAAIEGLDDVLAERMKEHGISRERPQVH